MNNKRLIDEKSLAIIFALASTSLYADTSNFEGFETGIGLGYVNADIVYTDSNPDRLNWDKNDTVVQVGIAYHWPINNSWLIGLGTTYDLNDTNAGTQSYGNEDIKQSCNTTPQSMSNPPMYWMIDRLSSQKLVITKLEATQRGQVQYGLRITSLLKVLAIA